MFSFKQLFSNIAVVSIKLYYPPAWFVNKQNKQKTIALNISKVNKITGGFVLKFFSDGQPVLNTVIFCPDDFLTDCGL